MPKRSRIEDWASFQFSTCANFPSRPRPRKPGSWACLRLREREGGRGRLARLGGLGPDSTILRGDVRGFANERPPLLIKFAGSEDPPAFHHSLRVYDLGPICFCVPSFGSRMARSTPVGVWSKTNGDPTGASRNVRYSASARSMTPNVPLGARPSTPTRRRPTRLSTGHWCQWKKRSKT